MYVRLFICICVAHALEIKCDQWFRYNTIQKCIKITKKKMGKNINFTSFLGDIPQTPEPPTDIWERRP